MRKSEKNRAISASLLKLVCHTNHLIIVIFLSRDVVKGLKIAHNPILEAHKFEILKPHDLCCHVSFKSYQRKIFIGNTSIPKSFRLKL